MQRYLYVIVHESCIDLDLRKITKDNSANSECGLSRHSQVKKELQRIKSEEDFVTVRDPRQITYEIPEGCLIRVCGAYGDVCVSHHLEELQKQGIASEIYNSGTVWLDDNPKELRSSEMAFERLKHLSHF